MSRLYCTVAEWVNWPSGLDTQDLIPAGSSDQNAAQLATVLAAACSHLEQITYQPLYARSVTEAGQGAPAAGCRLNVRLGSFPCLAVTAAQWQPSTAAGWQNIPTAQVQIWGALLQQYTADGVGGGAWGPVQVLTQYVAGYPNAVLTSSCEQGATVLGVDDATGMFGPQTVGSLTVPGTTLTIYDSPDADGNDSTEQVTVASVSGTAVTLAAGTANAHGSGVRASALPYAVSEAAMLLVNWVLKERRAGAALVMQGESQGVAPLESEDLQMAKRLLAPFRRVI